MKLWITIFVVTLAGCAMQQTISLFPRGAGATQQGTGSLDRLSNELTVSVDGKKYGGRMMMNTATSTNIYGYSTSTTTNQATALLLGDGGQIRCEFGWDALMIQATGVCVDSKNVTYDMLIKN